MITEKDNSTKSEEVTKNQNVIIINNDDVNTFDHVINSLVSVCNHEPLQAEQCAHIIHNNGKCEVKTGDFEDLVPMCHALLDRNLSAEIQ